MHEMQETFDQGPAKDAIYPNRWPKESNIPGFRSFMQDFFDKCHLTHIALLGALELGLSLPPGFISNRCVNNSSELRLNHYPPCTASQIMKHGKKRIAEHSDFGTLTLLFQDDVGGFGVERHDSPGVYFPVAVNESKNIEGEASLPTTMIVNVGDCMQRWTNDRLKSARHRVVLPAGVLDPDQEIMERYSVA